MIVALRQVNRHMALMDDAQWLGPLTCKLRICTELVEWYPH